MTLSIDTAITLVIVIIIIIINYLVCACDLFVCVGLLCMVFCVCGGVIMDCNLYMCVWGYYGL